MRPWRIAWALCSGLILADHPLIHDFTAYQSGKFGDPPSQIYQSSNITSPVFNYNTWRKDLVAGDESSHLLLTLDYGGASGPYIFRDDDLSLVYADPSFSYAVNARIQEVNGTEYLSFWHGARNRGDSQGFCVFYDKHYQLEFNVTLGAPFAEDADMHECEVTPTGTLLLTAYRDKTFDLTSLGGKPDDVLADSCFQEVDIRTNAVIFSWCASDHFDPGLAFWNLHGVSRKRQDSVGDDSSGADTTSKGFDTYHINSLQKTWKGNYLVSLRNLKTITYLSGLTGEPIWNLGGRMNNFTDITMPEVLAANPESGGALSFGWQHHVRFTDAGETQIMFFDNHKLETSMNCVGSDCSRGRHLQISTSNIENPSVELKHDFRSPQKLASAIFGSMQHVLDSSMNFLHDSSTILLGWGVNPEFTEHTHDGELIRDIQYSILNPRRAFGGGGSVSSYRVLKHSWHGYPTWPPSVVTSDNGTLWVSWNGATEVRAWAVYGSDDSRVLAVLEGNRTADGLLPVKTVSRRGFETEIVLGSELPAFVKVAALDHEGEILGSTETVSFHQNARTTNTQDCLSQEALSFLCLVRLLV